MFRNVACTVYNSAFTKSLTIIAVCSFIHHYPTLVCVIEYLLPTVERFKILDPRDIISKSGNRDYCTYRDIFSCNIFMEIVQKTRDRMSESDYCTVIIILFFITLDQHIGNNKWCNLQRKSWQM